METIIQFLEENAGVESVELMDGTELGYLYTGYLEQDEDDTEVEIHVTFTNRVYFNDEEQDIYLPFNVWSIKEEMGI